MVVNDGHCLRAGQCPDEADPALIVDPDAVLTCAGAEQELETVPRRATKGLEGNRGVKLVELPTSHAPERLRTGSSGGLRISTVVDVGSPLVAERQDHDPARQLARI